MKNNKGFTLIELLVVVLIIGILAAIALPQYFKAVEKSRAAEANTIMGAVNHAQAVYLMGAQNAYTTNFAALDIDLPGSPSGTTYSSDDFTYTLSGTATGTAEIQALRKPGKYTLALRFVDGKRKCTDGTDTICASMGLTNAYQNN